MLDLTDNRESDTPSPCGSLALRPTQSCRLTEAAKRVANDDSRAFDHSINSHAPEDALRAQAHPVREIQIIKLGNLGGP